MMPKAEAVAYRAVFDESLEQSVDADAITISVLQNEVPAFIEQDLNRLYGSPYSSLPILKLNGRLNNASTYVVRKGGKAVNVFLFQLKGRKVEVLNEVIAISEAEIKQFATIIFSRFQSAKYIEFRSIQTDVRRLPFPYQINNCLEDIVTPLPATKEQFLAQLKKNMRSNIQRRLNKLKKEQPSISFEIYKRDEAPDQVVRDIVSLNRARMDEKNKVSTLDEEEVTKKIKMVKECGLICTATIDGKVCAGAIGFHVGNNYFLKVLAHDSAYDAYSLGILCCLHAINDCIARRIKEFHFMWGRYEYKYSLLGVRRDLDHLIVYRSPLQAVLNSFTALKADINGQTRRLMLWVHEGKGGNSSTYRAVRAIVDFVQGVKRAKLRLLEWRK